MHDRETVELFLLAHEDGMYVTAASAFVVVSRGHRVALGARRAAARLRGRAGGPRGGRISARKTAERKRADVDIRGCV